MGVGCYGKEQYEKSCVGEKLHDDDSMASCAARPALLMSPNGSRRGGSQRQEKWFRLEVASDIKGAAPSLSFILLLEAAYQILIDCAGSISLHFS